MANSLDVLIAAPAPASHLANCLLPFRNVRDVQVLVAHAGAVSPLLREQFPRVRWIACEPCATTPELWARAIAVSRAAWIAVLDAHGPIAEGWLDAARALCVSRYSLHSGAVEPRGLRSALAWAAYFCDYGAFMPPLATGKAREVAGNNLLLPRELLARAPEFVAPHFWKAHFVRALAAQGIAAQNAPALVVHYEKNIVLAEWLLRRVTHARCFAAMRATRAPLWRRVAFCMGAPLLPLLLLSRLARSVLPKRRYTREFWRALPWTLAGLSAWAFGEWLGYAMGAGSTCDQIF
ncbi:MAG: hypothetical protein LC737_06335 [Chloroflexi bacterium]|nr:hypothetical protein [Chloroflexota bacterium]